MAYPIEDLWAIIKPRIKRRQPQSLEELKKFALEEWNLVPNSIIQNLTKGYLNRIKKVIELKGERIEPEYFKKIEMKLNIFGIFLNLQISNHLQ